ncbi:glycosyltransferase family 1 protein [Methylomonas sp. AM2-LC]|uniref:glycosyltransferase family 4 protein n=1 Tax=Methylomonas sp. AM2-LC TaxID=3153301 RepID=UPI003265A27C
MRIIFDAYELVLGQGKSIGIYNYAKNLLNAMTKVIDNNTEIIVICNASNRKDFTIEHTSVSQFIVSDSVPGKFSRLAWFFGQAALNVKKLAGDIYFSPKGFLPIGINYFSPNIKTVIVIHDLIPLWYADHHPGYFGRLEELFINTSIVSSIKRTDKIIAISKTTADDITARFGCENTISVVHNGITTFPPSERKYAFPYIFAMASQLPHKNAAGVLAAYQTYRDLVANPLPLVFCGVTETNQPGVIAVKGINDNDLHACYAFADLFVFLSLIEGFGFPPIEALAHGTPVLCSDIPSLREIGKDFATYVDPTKPDLAAKKIATLLTENNSASLKLARTAFSQEYSWTQCASKILMAINC